MSRKQKSHTNLKSHRYVTFGFPEMGYPCAFAFSRNGAYLFLPKSVYRWDGQQGKERHWDLKGLQFRTT